MPLVLVIAADRRDGCRARGRRCPGNGADRLDPGFSLVRDDRDRGFARNRPPPAISTSRKRTMPAAISAQTRISPLQVVTHLVRPTSCVFQESFTPFPWARLAGSGGRHPPVIAGVVAPPQTVVHSFRADSRIVSAGGWPPAHPVSRPRPLSSPPSGAGATSSAAKPPFGGALQAARHLVVGVTPIVARYGICPRSSRYGQIMPALSTRFARFGARSATSQPRRVC